MAAPHRGNTGTGTYFITAGTFQKKQLLQSDRMARLFVDVLFGYRSQEKYLLHEFVLMPDHFHLLITPLATLERALQLIKGGFSFRAKKELGFQGEIWEKSFYDRRVRDWGEYSAFRQYIHRNPVKRGLALAPEAYPYSSARTALALDSVPLRLKPSELGASTAAVNRCATQKPRPMPPSSLLSSDRGASSEIPSHKSRGSSSH
jgi:putative transposase